MSETNLAASVRLRLGGLSLDVELTAAAGERLAVVGPNGSGKTTLLRAVAGLLPLEAGRVVLDGAVLEDAASGVRVPPHRRRVGLVFQDRLLFPHLSVLDNVAFGPRSQGAGRLGARRRAEEWLERVGLADRAADRAADLSGGEAQRVALCRALATDPRLVLLDEPLSAVDAASRAELRRALRRHLAEFDGAQVLVTHDPLEALAMADRVVVLEAGRVTQAGPVADVVARPRSSWAAALVGRNLFRGRAAAGAVQLEGGESLAVAGRHEGPVFAVVHPRAVALHRRRPEGSARNVWSGTVADVDLGDERARVRVEGSPPIVAEVTPAAVAELALGEGGTVWVSVKATEVDVYPE